jgi:hypothetical protein
VDAATALRGSRLDALPDQVVAYRLTGRQVEQRRVPSLDLHIGEQVAEELRSKLGVEGQRRRRQRMPELGRVMPAGRGHRDEAAGAKHPPSLGQRPPGLW